DRRNEGVQPLGGLHGVAGPCGVSWSNGPESGFPRLGTVASPSLFALALLIPFTALDFGKTGLSGRTMSQPRARARRNSRPFGCTTTARPTRSSRERSLQLSA